MDHIISFDTMYVLWYGCVTTGIANSGLASSLWIRLCPFTHCLCCGADVILQESLIPKSAKIIIDQNVSCDAMFVFSGFFVVVCFYFG